MFTANFKKKLAKMYEQREIAKKEMPKTGAI